MPSDFLTLVFDVIIIVVGAGVFLNALIQIYIELRVKDVQGNRSYSWYKLSKHFIFLTLGVLAVLSRIWYIMYR